MQKIALFALLGLGANSAPPIANLRKLEPTDFNSVLSQQKLAVVEFFSPLCRHCRSFERSLLDLEAFVEAQPIGGSYKASVFQVNCHAHQAFCSGQGIRRIPVTRVYRNGALIGRDLVGYNNSTETLNWFKGIADSSPK